MIIIILKSWKNICYNKEPDLTTVMLDTNTFFYIYDNDLVDKIKNCVDKGKVQLFVTHIQLGVNDDRSVKDTNYKIVAKN